MHFNGPNYKEHQKEYFNQRLFQQNFFSVFYIRELYFVHRFLCKINEVISIYFKINFEKSLGKVFFLLHKSTEY